MWFLLMLIILLTNGMSAFGLKVMAAWALPGSVKFPYLAIWYAAGLVSVGAPMILRGVRLRGSELLWGALMAALSIAGQVAMAVALEANVPGHIVFPIAIGGSIFIVALAGRVFFHERMNRLTLIGIAIGLVSVVLLGMS